MDMKKLPVLAAVVLAAGFIACGQETPLTDQQIIQIDTVAVIEPVQADASEEAMIAYVMENCICPQCPSWIPEAAERGEGGYCAVGVSECIVNEHGCICSGCPVTLEKGLQWGYYCTRGSAAEMAVTE